MIYGKPYTTKADEEFCEAAERLSEVPAWALLWALMDRLGNDVSPIDEAIRSRIVEVWAETATDIDSLREDAEFAVRKMAKGTVAESPRPEVAK